MKKPAKRIFAYRQLSWLSKEYIEEYGGLTVKEQSDGCLSIQNTAFLKGNTNTTDGRVVIRPRPRGKMFLIAVTGRTKKVLWDNLRDKWGNAEYSSGRPRWYIPMENKAAINWLLTQMKFINELNVDDV